jgi:hypothetical protein
MPCIDSDEDAAWHDEATTGTALALHDWDELCIFEWICVCIKEVIFQRNIYGRGCPMHQKTAEWRVYHNASRMLLSDALT